MIDFVLVLTDITVNERRERLLCLMAQNTETSIRAEKDESSATVVECKFSNFKAWFSLKLLYENKIVFVGSACFTKPSMEKAAMHANLV